MIKNAESFGTVSTLICFLIFLCGSCSSPKNTPSGVDLPPTPATAKFEPEDGQCLFFIGQDLAATGGLDDYTNGYCDHFDTPAGFTVYTNFSPGGESYGYYNKGNDGINTTANWGSGDCCAQCYIDDQDYQHSIVSVGLSLVNHEKRVAQGEHDDLIRELGEWIKSTQRPVFLRIGYEFDGWGWNHYNKKHYLAAWKHIHTLFQKDGVDNVAYVWQSKGTDTGQDVLEEWYPGDDLVDWCGYSYFGNPDEEMLTFARRHGKPVFIAEATPVLQDGSLYFSAGLTNDRTATRVWEEWFVPFFKTLHDNQDVIKAFAYINTNWPAQPMWLNNPTFQQVDSRIQESAFISEKWLEEISKPRYLKPGPTLFQEL